MSYSPGAEEQHKGELKHARQHGVELLETWLILEYCDCGSLEDATLEGKYIDDLVRRPTIPNSSLPLVHRHACMQCTAPVKMACTYAIGDEDHRP